MKFVALTLALTLAASASAQTFTDPANLRGERVSPLTGHELPIDQGALGLAQLLRKLNTRASILNIVAHPDDEDGGMLTLYARGFGARVTDLALTRGEGGQNFVTGDFEDALGLIRTQELLANDRYTGVQQLFGTEVDFGFSKTKEEAFAKWTHARVLYDAVRAIRLVRPLVITATFIGNVTDGHGQHQVSGEIAQEAFKAAANPNVFPDQIAEGLLPWQALKIYARVPFAEVNEKGVYDYATGQYVPARFTNYVTGKVTTAKPAADVTVPEGSNDPLLTVAAANPTDIPAALAAKPTEPLSYIQFGRIGLSLQRSQISKNMTLPVAGFFNSGYTLYGSVLCNAPAAARPTSLTSHDCHPEQAQRAEGPATKPAPPKTSSASSPQLVSSSQVAQGFSLIAFSPNNKQVPRGFSLVAFSPDDKQVPRGFSLGSHGPSPESGFSPQGMPLPSGHKPAPTARSITAQGEALGLSSNQSARAESPLQNPNLTTQPNFFTGIDTSIEGIATLAPSAPPFLHFQLARLTKQVEAATQAFDLQNPAKVAPSLRDALQTTDALIGLLSSVVMDPTQKANALHELWIKRVQLNDALALALGVHLDATASSSELVANSTPAVKTHLTEESRAPLIYESMDIYGPGPGRGQSFHDSITPQISSSRPLDHDWQILAEHMNGITKPYFYRDNIEQPVYQLRDSALRNASQTPAPLTAWAAVTYQGAEIKLGRIVHNNGQPISIIPPVSIASAPAATVLPPSQPPAQTTAQLTATLRTDAATSANINVQSPHNWSIEAKAAGPNSVNFFLHPTAPITTPQTFHVTAETPDHHTYTEGFRPVGYPGLILTNYYTPATTRVVPVDLKLPQNVRIAYLPGTGDAVPEALASIGLAPTMITVADLTPTKLASFNTVILGVRAYTANPDLHGAPSQALLDFARNGGNVLLQYQSSDFTAADAPYPLSLGSAEKVVDETAPVHLLPPGKTAYPEPSATGSPSPGKTRYPEASASGSPSPGKTMYPEASATGSPSPGKIGYPEASASGLIGPEKEGVLTPGYALLNVPNKITSADFNNWIAERGHGFLTSWNDHYTALTETHDPGGPVTPAQLPQRGGLITVQLGNGRWTYCAFALYRQLPEAVPGAYRLFVNLITPTH